MDNLSLFRCKNCGGEVDVRLAVNGVIDCKYCHTPWTAPKQETVSEAVKYLHDANAALDVCDFEDAFTYFQRAAELDKNEPEAYFGMALAQFKVQYLKDEVNDCLQPICHEISEKVFTEDKNYKKALELATVEQKKVYRRKGGEIDDIRDEFLALQKSGLSYDCFLCVKVTEENGTHTEDYHRANDIYYHLKDNGYKPFYSEREMKMRTGSAYEALILYALYTSACMLIVCSNEDYLQTKWVKNEYTRFINLMQEGGKERDALTFVFAGKPIERLPNGKKIQGIDLFKPDAYFRITGYVEKHKLEAKKRREEEEERKRREEEERRRAYLAQFEIQDGALKKYKGQGGKVVIPNGVTSIGEEGFKDCTGLTSIVIPDGVTSIGGWAFRGCSGLTSIVIPDSVTSIGKGAFSGCTGLTSIVIPDSVTSIGKGAFSGCSGLTEIKVDSNNQTYHAKDNCLIETKSKTLVAGCKTSKIPDDGSVTSIGVFAFEGCSGLTSLIIPDSVTSIGKYAFYECTGLTSIVIPNSVNSIGEAAFSCCTGLTSIVIPNSVTSIGDCAFEGCSGLTSIVIPDSVTSIGYSAFRGCSGLTEIKVDSNNQTYHAKDNCLIETKSKTLVAGCKTSKIPDDGSVTSIGKGAFAHCSGLTSIVIPDSVTSIGKDAFAHCSGLTSIVIPDGVTSIGDRAFVGCSGLTSIVIPDSVTSIGKDAFSFCKGLTSIVIPDSVTSIGSEAFIGCKGLTSIVIPDSVTSIGKDAFSFCKGLISIVIPDSVTSIGDSAFSGCKGLTSIVIPDSVTSIGKHAFDSCEKLQSIEIPDSVTSIGEAAFEDCTGLRKVTIPKRFDKIFGTKLQDIFNDAYKNIQFTFI